jgi:hypothetical protein
MLQAVRIVTNLLQRANRNHEKVTEVGNLAEIKHM